jgi:hypothetical protein
MLSEVWMAMGVVALTVRFVGSLVALRLWPLVSADVTSAADEQP